MAYASCNSRLLTVPVLGRPRSLVVVLRRLHAVVPRPLLAVVLRPILAVMPRPLLAVVLRRLLVVVVQQPGPVTTVSTEKLPSLRRWPLELRPLLTLLRVARFVHVHRSGVGLTI